MWSKSSLAKATLAVVLSLLAPGVLAQETEAPAAKIEVPYVFEDDGSRVAVLGYHVFHATKEPSQMRIKTAKFREQMKAVKESGFPVITLDQFLKWRRGEGEVPPQSILITMDDGWKSVYTEAFPIMKELELPFTIFLYKNYVGSDKGTRALSIKMINEMVESKLCTIGCHSVSHPFPGDVKKAAANGPEAYEKFLRTELGESKSYLEKKFQTPVTTYAYPGGYHTDEMFSLADEFGYDHLFTVKPGKVRRDSPRHTLPRYIVLGNHDGAFKAAMIFRNGSRVSSQAATLPYPVSPEPGEIIASRLPIISANLSEVTGLDPSSLTMRVGGFEKVPHEFDARTEVISWKVTRPLRQPICPVSISWKLIDDDSSQPPLRWTFLIDHEAAYQEKERALTPHPGK